MKTTKTKTLTRIATLVLAGLLLLGVLSGCTTKQTLVKPEVNDDAFDTVEDNKRAKKLENLAKMIAYVYASDFNSQEMLIAASRGYDMLAEDFDDTGKSPADYPDQGVDLSAVITLIAEAKERAEASDKTYAIGFDVVPATEESVEETDGNLVLTEADVDMLVVSLQSAPDPDAARGWLDTLLGWIGTFLGWMTRLFGGSYIGAICLFAILVEILLLPLSIKQHKGSIKQAKLKPKEMAIKKKYAGRDDQVTKQKMSAELQELYQKENVNMASGCLPLLIQMPIILALYNIVIDPLRYVLGQAVEFSNALLQFCTASPAAGGLGRTVSTGRGTIAMLSELTETNITYLESFAFYSNSDTLSDKLSALWDRIPNFNLFGLNFGLNPSLTPEEPRLYWLVLVPVLTFVVYFSSMRLTKKFTYQSTLAQDQQTACSGWLMDIYMPGMSTFFAFMVPALVGVYWMFKSVVSTLRQFIVTRLMPYPQFTEDDFKAAEREYAGKAPKKGQSRAPRAYEGQVRMVDGKPRSLFHMDDDDYLAKVEAEEAAEKAEQTETGAADAGRVEGVALKQDDRPQQAQRKKKSKSAPAEDGQSDHDQDPAN